METVRDFETTKQNLQNEISFLKTGGGPIPTGEQAKGSFSGKASLDSGSTAILNENKKMVNEQRQTNKILMSNKGLK